MMQSNENSKNVNMNDVQLIHEFVYGSRHSSVKLHDNLYIVDLYSHRGIEARSRYDNLESAKTVAEDWVFDK